MRQQIHTKQCNLYLLDNCWPKDVTTIMHRGRQHIYLW
jgi:hypothetical protein